MKNCLVVLFTLIFLSASVVNAQIPTSIDGVEIFTNINNPKPGQSVDVVLESLTIDLNSSSMVWTVDGKNYASGIGISRINVTAPQIGIPLNISVIIKDSQGKEIRKSLPIKTTSVDIIWESAGYVPPFYKGKSQFSYQNGVKFVAIPHLSRDGKTELDPKSLVYTWKRDGKYIVNGQGYGVQSVIVPGDELPKNMDITVEVHNKEQDLSASGGITLTPGEPTISFYEDNPLYGIMYNKSLFGNIQMLNREMKILATPFGFTNQQDNTYVWSVNNIEQGDLIRNKSIVIRTKEDTEGSSNIYLDVRNQENILQGARGGFAVYFSKENTR